MFKKREQSDSDSKLDIARLSLQLANSENKNERYAAEVARLNAIIDFLRISARSFEREEQFNSSISEIHKRLSSNDSNSEEGGKDKRAFPRDGRI